MEEQVRGLVNVKRNIDGEMKSLHDLGYKTIGLDDGWQECTGWNAGKPRFHNPKTGAPLINKERFPDMHGMVKYAHSLGVKMGWYFNNCECKEKNRNMSIPKYYQADVDATVKFEFDAVKLDNCGDQLDIEQWQQTYAKSGRDIEIEGCYWGDKGMVGNETWCPGHMFRAALDIDSNYGRMLYVLKHTLNYMKITRPGCWAYADMLEVGITESPFEDSRIRNFTLSDEENRQHFGAWVIVSSPLVLSHDLTDESKVDEVWPLIANPELIAVNQAWYQRAGGIFKQAEGKKIAMPNLFRKWQAGHTKWPRWTYLYKPLGPDKVAVLLMNMGDEPLDLKVDFSEIPMWNGDNSLNVRDLFERRDIAHDVSSYTCEQVKGHDCCFLYISTETWEDGTGKYWSTESADGIESASPILPDEEKLELKAEVEDLTAEIKAEDQVVEELKAEVGSLTDEVTRLREELAKVKADKRRSQPPVAAQVSVDGSLPHFDQQQDERTTFLFQTCLVFAIVGLFLRHLWANRHLVESKLIWYFAGAFFCAFTFFAVSHTYMISLPMIMGTLTNG